MFKEGNYIVTLKVRDWYDDNCAKDNYCFKQRIDSYYINPEIDLKGAKDNGHQVMTSDKSKRLLDWRYATEEEIEEYERFGGPFDVTDYNPFILPKNWHIIVTEENAEDVLKWRFEKNYLDKDKVIYLDNLVGICVTSYDSYEKGHNLKYDIKGDSYDFGIEITYPQFKKYVLNKKKENMKYLIPILKEHGIQ